MKPKHGHSLTKDKRSPTYISWNSMLQRTFYKGSGKGGYEGVPVCSRWLTFSYFLEDMGERPKGTTLDRKDNSKGYFKENCRWATNKEQSINRRSTVFYEYQGRTLCMADWAKELGFTRSGFKNRIKRLGFIAAVESQREDVLVLTVGGVTKSLNEWSIEVGIKPITIHKRIQSGWSHEEAILTPVGGSKCTYK